MRTSFVMLGIVSVLLCGGAEGREDVWAPLRFFAGRWEGKAASRTSVGTATREYEFIFDGAFLQARDAHVYEMSTSMPEGQVHEEIGLISYDRIRKTFVLRQFHGEGFVNQYALDSLSAGGLTIVFVSESIENVPPGWRAMERYERLGDDEFIEFFKLAPPGGEFEVYTETHFTRVQ